MGLSVGMGMLFLPFPSVDPDFWPWKLLFCQVCVYNSAHMKAKEAQKELI